MMGSSMRGEVIARWAALALVCGAGLVTPAAAQLNEFCTVSVLNRNATVNPNGTWTIPNVPAGFGRVRARATCVQNGLTRSGESGLFTINPNLVTGFNSFIQLGATTPIPTNITITTPTPTITSLAGATQLTITGTFTTGPTQNLTASSTGTAYLTTNPAIATVSSEGLVTAVSTGTVVIQATNEGASGMISIRVLPSGAGDSDGDGIPDDFELSHGLNAHDPTDALLDPDRDGLSNLREFQLGTDMNVADTDGDGINDGDEVNGTGRACTTAATPVCYRTNPLIADTDNDGVWDLTEIRTGSDPTNPASLNLGAAMDRVDVTPASFTMIVNTLTNLASVQLTVTGHLIDNRTIDLTSTTRGTNYTSDNLAKCNFGIPDGRVFASSAGSCTITVVTNGYTRTVTGTVQDFTPARLSTVAVPGYANGVAVQGDYAYVAAGNSGLQVVSLSTNRLTPTVVGSLALAGTAWHVTLAGTRAIVSGTSGIQIVNISDPLHPALMGTFSTGSTARGARVRGQLAYVASGSGLTVVNVSNPASMILVSSFNIGGTCYNLDVDAAATLAAVACGTSGMKLVDVTNPAAPVGLGSSSTGDPRAVALKANLAVVGDFSNGITSVNIANRNTPVIVGSMGQVNGGRDNDIALGGPFAMAADVLFVNGVPIADLSDPTLVQSRSPLIFCANSGACAPYRDDNGMGIAVDASFIYMVGTVSGFDRGGANGDSRLYIGQYQPRQDLAGVAPTISIVSPLNNTTQYRGASLTVTVNATDDVAVSFVDFLVNGQIAFTTSTEPFQYTFTVPSGTNSITLGARATDLGNNVATAANVVVPVVPDPLTLVTGLVVNDQAAPVAGAQVTTAGGLTGVTGANGRFAIANVPTVLGNIIANATATDANNNPLSGSSAGLIPVRGGSTDVGTISLIAARFETSYGTRIINCDDCSFTATLPFSFPFYGTNQTTAYVGSNGYITFGQPSSNYTESLPEFQALPRISAFFDDLDTRCGASTVYHNLTLPGRYVVTYDRVQHYSCNGQSNTMQIQLFSNGKIIIAYAGITTLNLGSITGLNPGPNTPSLAVDFSAQVNVNVTPNTAVYQYFNDTSLFDIDHTFLVFTPLAGGGYNVRTILAPNPSEANILSGGVAAPEPGATGPVLRGVDLARAEVTVRSSGNVNWVRNANTDANGNFLITGIPAGGITVTVQRNGKIIATGSGILTGGTLGQQQVLQIGLTAPVPLPGK
ncbi:MAG: Ig-like domain-containing protein [Candidatus Solibacter sp.]